MIDFIIGLVFGATLTFILLIDEVDKLEKKIKTRNRFIKHQEGIINMLRNDVKYKGEE